MKIWSPTAHPVLRLPTAAKALAMGAAEWQRQCGRGGERERIIAQEKAEPFLRGWEPPIWRVCDALLGFDWVPPEEASAYREALGFRKPVDVLLINGGQRAAKTTYGIKRLMKVLRGGPERNAWCFHSNLDMSIQWHQSLCQQFLPAHLRGRKIQSSTTYIAYKRQTGFSEQKFILDNLSTCKFRTYEQDPGSIEGANLDYIFCDELVPPEVVRTLQLRIAERGGKMVIGFTPVEGYTETVREFQDGATVQRESVAFLCPNDGGPPDVARALGLSDEDYVELQTATEQKRVCLAPQSGPERCDGWLNETLCNVAEKPGETL
jgi:phage terminase large subunit-like protein